MCTRGSASASLSESQPTRISLSCTTEPLHHKPQFHGSLENNACAADQLKAMIGAFKKKFGDFKYDMLKGFKLIVKYNIILRQRPLEETTKVRHIFCLLFS